jgi:two-component system chemotaxis family response regulator WspR
MTDELNLSESGASKQPDEYKATVLLVDDQIMVVEAVRRALTGQPNLVFHYCLDPNMALALAIQIKPTVILQDLIMPGIDGLEMVRLYRTDAATASIPIIVLSTKEEAAIKSRAFADGANDYLVKLPDRVELIARICYHTTAYLNRLQRDDAYRALHESQQQLLLANLKLERITRVDGLTGLGNRRYFDEYYDLEWKRYLREQGYISILMIDVDNFKLYNDTYGHLAGDEVLIRVAETIQQSCARSTDFAARFGGEEFVVLLSNTPMAGALHLATDLCHAIAALQIPHSGSTAARFVTVSIGVAAIVPQLERLPKMLIETADRALYQAKNAGKNRAVTFNTNLLK